MSDQLVNIETVRPFVDQMVQRYEAARSEEERAGILDQIENFQYLMTEK